MEDLSKGVDWTRRLDAFDLRSVVVVAEAGSFRSAAQSLNVTQSAVSRRIQKLEALAGVSFFERNSTGARLTLAGQCFVSSVRSSLDKLEYAIQTAQAAAIGGNGLLRIGLIASLSRGVFRDVVGEFSRRFPGVSLDFIESDRSDLLRMLSHRELDLVFASGVPHSEVREISFLVCEDIFLAVPATGSFAIQDRLEWSDIANATFLVSAHEPGPEIHDYLIRRVSDVGQRVSVRRHLLGREGIMSLVGMGFGVSLVADHWRGVSYPGVHFVPIGGPEECVPFSLCWRPENDNPSLQRFLQVASDVAKQSVSKPSQ